MTHQKRVQNSMKPGRWINSTCKMCLHSCNTRVHIGDDGIVNKIEGNPTSPSNRGRLCPKGNSAIMRHYDPNRFKTPLKRTNPEKGPGIDPKWQPIGWDEAFELVARELKKSISEDPRKLLPAINDFQKLFLWAWPACFGNANYFSSVGNFCGGGYHPMNGFIHAAFAAANDPNYCDYWINNGGGDGFSSHLHVTAQANAVANARIERGMKVVVVEPRMSIGGAKADEWVPIRPATDRQFALSMCHVLVEERLFDIEFLKHDTNAPYLVGPDGYFVRNSEGKIWVWDAKSQCARLNDDPGIGDFALEGEYEVDGVKCRPSFQVFKDILKDCSPEAMEKVTTVPAATVRRITRDFARHAQIGRTIEIEGRRLPLRPAAYNYYRGAQGHKYSAMANQAFKLVNFLVGNIDAPGGHVGVTVDDQQVDRGHVEPGENGMMKTMPHQLHPEVPFSYPPNETHLNGFFPIGVDPGHLTQAVLDDPEKFGLNYRPDVMLLCHTNPLWNLPGSRKKWFDIMRSMRFIVAIDIIPNDTNAWADVILPSHDSLESWNMTMIEPPNTEGMCLRQPAGPPLYDTRSEEAIFYELSERLGVLEIFNDILNFVNGFAAKPELMLDRAVKHSDRDIAERKGLLWNDKPLDWYMEHGHAVTPRRPDKWYRPWDGMRLHFYIEEILTARDTLKKKMEDAGVPYRHEWEWDDYQALPNAVLDPVHLEPKEFDIYAVTFKDIQINFGESLSNPWISDIVWKDPVHTAFLINAKTGRDRGFASGDLVMLESPYGSIFGKIGLSEEIHPETIAVSNALTRIATQHSGVRHGGGNFNDLLPANLRNTDACSGQPETVARVKIRKIDKIPADLPANSIFLSEGA